MISESARKTQAKDRAKPENKAKMAAYKRQHRLAHRAYHTAIEAKSKAKNPAKVREKHNQWRYRRQLNGNLPSRPCPDRCEARGCAGPLVMDHDHITCEFRGWI